MNIHKQRAEANLEAAQRLLMEGKTEAAVDAVITSIGLTSNYLEQSLDEIDRKLDYLSEQTRKLGEQKV